MRWPRTRFRVRTLMLLVAAVAVGLEVVNLANASRAAAARTGCVNNLKQMGLALLNYQSAQGTFPSATLNRRNTPPDRRLSWIFLLLAYLEQSRLVIDTTEPWDSPGNALLLVSHWPDDNGPPSYSRLGEFQLALCPLEQGRHGGSGPSPTSYVGIAGVGADAPTLPLGHPRCGLFGYDRHPIVADVTDGLATTMAVAETLDGGPWTAGGPSTVRAFDPAQRPYIGPGRPFHSRHPGGVNVLFADGSVRFVRQSTDPRVLEALATIAGGEVVDVTAATGGP